MESSSVSFSNGLFADETLRLRLVRSYRPAVPLFSAEERRFFYTLYRRHAEKLTVGGVDDDTVSYKFLTLLRTLEVLLVEMNLGRTAAASCLSAPLVENGLLSLAEVEKRFGHSASSIVAGLIRVRELYARSEGATVATDNFRQLFLQFAEDLRVVLICIAERLVLMRTLDARPAEEQRTIATEVSFLYAPLAHRLGLYHIKSVLEDLSLKYTNRAIYSEIAHKLNETKRSRDAYIKSFIEPLREKIQAAGYDFEIKGRTKSIFSIYNKIVKKKTPFEDIYDLFAIRIILNSRPEVEKAECWQVYSMITDMYRPNPSRLRDWLSIPKSNGYESLHITVLGPQQKWVEVQIRTRRMDEVAEKGLAAHWKYKGVSSEAEMDAWLSGIREILENPEMSAMDFMDNFRLNLYDKEVFVFTPNGELLKLPKGATVLDFAFNIHSRLGCQCIGATVGGKAVPLRYELQNGDQVQILTSSTQSPRQDWLSMVVTTRAKNKIRQSLKEAEAKEAAAAREVVERRLKNWKIDLDESKITRLTKKLGYKSVTELYRAIASERLDIFAFRDEYLALDAPVNTGGKVAAAPSVVTHTVESTSETADDVLTIDKDLKGIDYTLAKCCHPIYGDEVFGFVSSQGGVKIHRTDCPNAPLLLSRFGYRCVKARWAGKAGTLYPLSLRIVGAEDVGLVSNISSVIAKEPSVLLRSITVDTADGVSVCDVVVLVPDASRTTSLLKRLGGIHGVTSVSRTVR